MAEKRTMLPRGSASIWVGLLVNGVTSYLFLVLAARRLSSSDYDAMGVLWATAYIVGPGVFLPVEQETARASAVRRARGEGVGLLLRRAAVLTAAMVAIVVVLAVPALLAGGNEELFGDSSIVGLWLLVAVVGYAATFLARGVLAGDGDFGRYSITVGGEGGFRILLTLALVVAGVSTVGAYGGAYALAPWIGAAAAFVGRPRVDAEPGPPAPWGELSSSLAVLLVGSIARTAMLNIAPVAYRVLAPRRPTVSAGALFSAMILAGIPFFLFQAVQSALLPQLAGQVATDDRHGYRSTLQRITLGVIAFGVLSVSGAAILGPWALDLVFGQDIGSRDLALLTLSAVIFMLTSVVSLALLAHSRHRDVMWGWLAGALSMGAGLAVGIEPLLRVEVALLVGPVVAGLVMMAALQRTSGSR